MASAARSHIAPWRSAVGFGSRARIIPTGRYGPLATIRWDGQDASLRLPGGLRSRLALGERLSIGPDHPIALNLKLESRGARPAHQPLPGVPAVQP